MNKINGNYKIYNLDNGLNVALQKTPNKTISGVLKVDYGAVHEKKGEEGIAHFLEHALISGGTKKYSPKVAEKLIGQLGYFNAMTTLDKTSFISDMLPEDLESYINFISELAFNPRLDETKVKEEKQRVLREIGIKKSKANFNDISAYRNAILGDHPSKQEILGNETIIENGNPKQLRKFHDRGYHAKNMNLILVGDLSTGIEEIIEDCFGDKPRGSNHKYKFPEASPLKEKKKIHNYAPDLRNKNNLKESNSEITIGFYAPHSKKEGAYEIRMLNHIFGGDFSSRLFKELSKKNGLAYSIASSYNGDYNKGVVEVNTSVPSIKQNQAINLIFKEIDKLRKNKVSEYELNRANKNIRYKLANHLDTTAGKIDAIETHMESGESPKDIMQKYAAITPRDLLNVANKYFPESKEDGKYVLLIRDALKKE